MTQVRQFNCLSIVSLSRCPRPRLYFSSSVVQAQSIWIFSSIYLAVGLALLCASYLFWRKPDFPSKGHAYLGIVIAIIGFLSFAFEIASFFNEDLLVVFGVTTLFWGVVAFPVCHTTYYPSTITFFLPFPLADPPRGVSCGSCGWALASTASPPSRSSPVPLFSSPSHSPLAHLTPFDSPACRTAHGACARRR